MTDKTKERRCSKCGGELHMDLNYPDENGVYWAVCFDCDHYEIGFDIASHTLDYISGDLYKTEEGWKTRNR